MTLFFFYLDTSFGIITISRLSGGPARVCVNGNYLLVIELENSQMFKKTNKPYHVLMIGDISQSGFREFSKGFAEYSRTHGGWVLYFNSPFYRNPNLKEITAQDIRRWTIHGIVDGITDSAKTREILSLNLPTI